MGRSVHPVTLFWHMELVIYFYICDSLSENVQLCCTSSILAQLQCGSVGVKASFDSVVDSKVFAKEIVDCDCLGCIVASYSQFVAASYFVSRLD